KTTVTINGDSEVLHTSCSCRATPETNLALCNPACLDSSSPDNTTGFKGAPSPLWTLVGLKDPKLGTETCGGTVGGGTEGECTTDLPTPPAGGTASADVTYTYKITNKGTTTVHNVTVEDDKLGTIAGSPIASIAPGGMATLTVTQSVAGTTLNTVTVKGNNGFCEATATAAVVAPCVLGYPFTSPDPRTSVVFNESEVLRAFRPSVARPGERLMVFYNDEHALTLGVRRVLVKTSAGTSMTDYPLSPLTSSPDGVLAPQVGTMTLDGDQAGTDTSSCAGFPDLCDRPLFPALFITDITDDPSSRAGDWQFGGTPIAPDAVFGTWRRAGRRWRGPPFPAWQTSGTRTRVPRGAGATRPLPAPASRRRTPPVVPSPRTRPPRPARGSRRARRPRSPARPARRGAPRGGRACAPPPRPRTTRRSI